MLKTKTFFEHLIPKPPASTLEFKNFDFILQNISVTPDKNRKSPLIQLAPLVPGQAYAMACGNAYVKHFAKFPDYFKTQCWQP